MKRSLYFATLSGVLSGLFVNAAAAQISPEDAHRHDSIAREIEAVVDFDIRYVGDQVSPEVRGLATAGRPGFSLREREADVRSLAQRVPGLRVDYDPIFGTPRFVRSPLALLTRPAPVEAEVVVESFVAAHRALFEIDVAELENARRSRDYVTRHNGVRHLEWQQEIDGTDIFGAHLRANVTQDGALINVASTMLVRPDGDFDVPPTTLRPLQAIHRAADSVGIVMTVEPAPILGTGVGTEADSTRIEWSQTPDFRTNVPVSTELYYFPLNRRELHPAWRVHLPEKEFGNAYHVFVDAVDGTILHRWNAVNYLVAPGGTQDIQIRAYTSDSPAPGTPGPSTPNGTQFPEVAAPLLTISSSIESPNNWIDDGGNETLGNNVDAHLDLDADDSPDLPRPQGSPFRVFDIAADFTQAPSTYRDASVTQLFYLCNRFHDRLYQLGFDEAAGNFQNDNFGLGGLGGDRVLADAQDGIGTNNARFFPSFEGSEGRMEMFIFTGPTPDRDDAFDADIVYHEYAHGLSHRLVGVGTLGGEQSGGMGEGWSDYYGLALNAEPLDDPSLVYAGGGWTTFNLGGSFTNNYYYGIRRFPYSTDMTKNPLTYADTDPAQNAYPPGTPQSTATSNDPDGVHKVGEVWCMTLLECRANLMATHGFAGNELLLQLVTDGMKLTPTNPNFLEARDGILQADLINNGGANAGELWAGFAKRGTGANSSSPAGGSSTTGVVDDFTVPALILFDFPGGVPDQLDPGQATTFDVNVTGLGGTTPTQGSGQLFVSVNGGAFTSSAMTENSPNQYTASLPAGSCFDQVEFYVQSGSTSGLATSPSNAPTNAYSGEVFTGTTQLFVDDFEVDLLWGVTDSSGLVEGTWERGVPVNNGRGDPPADSDGSGQCYLTENDPADSNSDIDDGTTTLTSPVIDMSSGGRISYDYWMDHTSGGEIGLEDSLTVEVATNAGGTNWQQVRFYQNPQPGWRTDTILVGTEVAVSSTIRIRFNATEVAPGDVLECGIDAVVAQTIDCDATSSSFCDDSDGALASCPCAAGDPDTGCDIAQATGGVSLAVLEQQTSPQNRVTLQGTGFPAMSTPAAVVIRASSLEGSPVIFGDGLRCIGTPVVRLGATFGTAGTSVHTFGHGAAAGAGDFYYQIWFRNTPLSYCDPVAAFNLSNGGSLTW
jgi:hypothetical protein